MRLKVFAAKSLSEAMARVRSELGADAVIVSVEQSGPTGLVRVVAAAEPQPVAAAEPAWAASSLDTEQLEAVLDYHAAWPSLAARIRALAEQHAEPEITEALAGALTRLVANHPVTATVETALILVGQSGQGKTLTAARLAAQARVAQREARVLTTDSGAAGAMPQLEAFCTPLGVEVMATPTAKAMAQALEVPFPGLTVIDTAGVNPYALPEIEQLARIVRASRAEPIWVLGCGGEPREAAEMATIMASLGVKRLIGTRADTTRRLGALLSATIEGGLALAGIADSPFVADPMAPASAHDLARRLLSRPDPTQLARISQKVA
jgi:flagellar biosynthesis protein FlhF